VTPNQFTDGSQLAKQVSWLLVGGDSGLAKATAKSLAATGSEVLFTSRRGRTGAISLDLNSPQPLLPSPAKSGVAILFAAITQQARCDADPIATRKINVDSTLTVARLLLDLGWSVVFISSDAVYPAFAPSPAVDPIGPPRNVYGQQKLDVEKELLKLGNLVSVLRLAKVVNFESEPWASWMRALTDGLSAQAFADYYLDPLTIAHAVSAILSVGQAGQGGRWQAGGAGALSYYELLQTVRARWKLPGNASAIMKGGHQTLGTLPSMMSSQRLSRSLVWTPPQIFDITDAARLRPKN